VLVRVTFNRTFDMPNAFSPNKDGINDVFRPKSQGVIAFAMQIYNRWGELLAQVSDLRKGWDGTSKGQPQPIGTYVYVVQYIFWDSEGKMVVQDKKGTFTLIR
jgi:gliding motility-associated-like protein